ncbi:MAG: phage tail protein [Burkholderiales bacterium]|nr:phage tail protein [Burkholderiales bacterium]
MLYMLGPVAFEIAPFNVTGGKFKGDFDFAEHKVLGSEPLYENMGGGSRTRSIKGVTFPNSANFEGGMAIVDVVEGMRRAGVPYHLFRGDFTPLGWFLITEFSADEDMLNFNGVPGELKFDLSLTQCDAPSVNDFVSIIAGFFP